MAPTLAPPLTVVGSSTESYAHATTDAVRQAAQTIRGISRVEVVSLRAVVAGDRVVDFQATLELGLERR